MGRPRSSVIDGITKETETASSDQQHRTIATGKESAKVLFIVTGLAIGGAEVMLSRLLSRMDRPRYATTVISLQGTGPIHERLDKLRVPVYTLGWTSPWGSPLALQRLTRLIASLQPDLIQGWMLHANVASLAEYLVSGRRVPILWNVRHSLHEDQGRSRSMGALIWFLGHVSSWPKWIVYNSQTSARQHEQLGYDARRTIVIPNGFDCDVLRPRPECRGKIRTALGVADDVPLIGLFARVHAAKDHPNFLRAARFLVSSGSRAHFLLVGRGTDEKNMAADIAARELAGRVHVLGERSDVPELLASVDVATSSSMAEAFPNVIGEAMACAVPCVVTDVGDSALLVGSTGRVVPRGDSAALAQAWREILELDRDEMRALGEAARARILQEFSLDQIAMRYERLYSEVVHD